MEGKLGSETFLLKLSTDEIVLVNLDVKEDWDNINLYWPNSEGSGIPAVWTGSDGGYEKEVCEVYEYANGELFNESLELFKPYDIETFVRRVIQKRDKYYPGNEQSTQDILTRMV